MGMMGKMMEFMMGRMGKEKKENMMEEMMPKMMGMMGGGKGKGGMMDMMSQMMPKMMEGMGSGDMMETMHEMMPRMMENSLTPMSEEQRRNMLTFCRKMLGEMEEKFLTQKGEANS